MKIEKVTLDVLLQIASADLCRQQIYIHPVKSLRPVSVESTAIGRYGFVNERIFVLLKVQRDPETLDTVRFENMHVFHFPKMALFLTSLETKDGQDFIDQAK